MKHSALLFLAFFLADPALHAGTITVTSTSDSGAGSLRQAIADATTAPGPDTIVFDPGLSGQTITLATEIVMDMDNVGNVTIDASSLPGGLTLSGGNATRLLYLSKTGATFGTVTLVGLTFTGGKGVGPDWNSDWYTNGGAILNLGGTLTLTHCTLSGNSAPDVGGAILNVGGMLTLTHCTLSGNSASISGGAIENDGTLTLTHCTLSGNSATEGGAIENDGTLTLANSIVSKNNAQLGADIYNVGGYTRVGNNIVQFVANFSTVTESGPEAIDADPLLAPLADNGGRTQTMALLPGSPALDAASALPGLDTDQRGLPRNRDGNAVAGALPDIGAYEAQVAPVSLGFNFNGGSPRSLLPAERAGAPGFAQTHWNNLSGNSEFTSSSRSLSGGATASMQMAYGSAGFYQYGSPATPDQKLMFGFNFASAPGNANSGTNLNTASNYPYFALADLPAGFTVGGYKVVVYADTDGTDDRISEYWLTTHSGDPANVSGTTDVSPHLFLKDSANFTGTYTRVPATSTTRAGAVAGNYLVFENQTQPAFILRTEDYPSPWGAILSAVQVVRNEILVVTTAADENDPVGTPGTGLSLREAIALAPDGAGIVFDSILSGQTITLSPALKDISVTKSVTIDASNLSGGLTISGGGATRLFSLPSGYSSRVVTLRGLTLSSGNGTGAIPSGYGGAIYKNGGTLTLTHCTLSGNSASDVGGAIYNASGMVTLTHCTLSGNTAGFGGAILNDILCTETLTHCTLSGNTAAFGGGAILNLGTLTLTHCTLSGNSSALGNAAIYNFRTLTLQNTIVAGNTFTGGSAGSDIRNENNGPIPLYTRIGANIVQYVSTNGTVNSSGPAPIPQPPLLAPLGHYGGPTQTMPPLAGSPAINAAVDSTTTTDQRGFPIVGTPDIGAAEYHPSTLVTVTADSGEGSLRQAIANAALIPGPNTITFDAALSGQTITLASEIVMNMTNVGNVTVDAGSLPGGVTIDGGPGTNRIFSISKTGSTFGTVTLAGLTLTGGNGTGAGYSGSGGAILKEDGMLTLAQCTLSGNSAPSSGGAIYNFNGTLTLTQCTLSGNSAGSWGGAILNSIATLTLTHCTLSGNSAGGGGGAIYNFNTLTLQNTIAAGNTFTGGSTSSDILNHNSGFTPTYSRSGANIVQSVVNIGTVNVFGPASINQPPQLAALGNYGGPTQTRPPLAGSPANDAAVGSTITSDQRGFPIVGTPDIGAAEYHPSTIVTVIADSGEGSLRQAIANAALIPGPKTVTFDAALSGQTITLASEIVMNMNNVGDVTINASSLPGGITLSGGHATRIFSISKTGAPFGTVTLVGLTLTGGNGTGAIDNGYGGAIFNDDGKLTLTRCTLSGNTANYHGGAIYNEEGTLTLTHCTLSGNSAIQGGAIYNIYGALTLTHCTLSGNSAALGGGAISNFSTLTLQSTIVVGNTGSDIENKNIGLTPTYTRIGANIVQFVSNSGTVNEFGPDAIDQSPLLAPLANYGGPTQTMALFLGSPAINAAVGSTITADQRGFAINGVPDIGAFESDGSSTYDPYLVTETALTGLGSLPQALANAAAHAGPQTITFHPDVDGESLTLTSELLVNDPAGVTIDATALSSGFTLRSPGEVNYRLLHVLNGSTLTVRGVAFENGGGSGFTGHGGGILNEGTLTLERCTVRGCRSSNGGGLYSDTSSTLTLERCTVNGNNAPNGGGLLIKGSATLTQCTLAGNSAHTGAGLLTEAGSSVMLRHCTVATGYASISCSGVLSRGTLSLQHCALGQNSGAEVPPVDLLVASGTTTLLGANVIEKVTGTVAGAAPVLAKPLLNALDNYGGPTQTMPPQPGSPLLDQAVVLSPPLLTDQRGLLRPIGLRPDIGAVEGTVILVTTPVDEQHPFAPFGHGISLREAVRDIPAGGTIAFDRAVFTAASNTITLTKGPLNPQRDCTLNGSAIPGGITIVHAPTIIEHPQSLSVANGAAADFIVTVESWSGGVAHQWRKNGGDLSGKTSLILNLANVQESDEGLYDVMIYEAPSPGVMTRNTVTLGTFSVISQPASLVVDGAPVMIQRSPDGAMLALGASHTLSVFAIGPAAPALKYQWKRNGVNIPGATRSSYLIKSAQLAHAGAYTCVVRSGTGVPVASTTAEIGVVDARPRTVNLKVGGRFTATVNAAGNGLSFAWTHGQTTKSYTINPVTVGDAGPRNCTVTGLGGIFLGGAPITLNISNAAPALVMPLNLPAATIGQFYSYTLPVQMIPGAPATSFSLTGALPKGMSFNRTTGTLSGRPTASEIGGYALSFKAINLSDSSAPAAATLMVNVVPPTVVGTFAGPLERHPMNNHLGGRFDLTTTAAGGFSGSITFGAMKRSFKSQLLLSAGAGDVILRGNIPGIKLADNTLVTAFVEVFAAEQVARLTLTEPYGSVLLGTGWRKTTPAVAGQYNFRLDPGSVAGAPQGYGFGSFKVSATNTLRLTGKLPDGSPLLGSTFVGTSGEILVFQLLYGSKGSLVGQYQLTGNDLSGSVSWFKPLATTGTVYKDGFGPLDVTAAGGLYTPPAAGQLVMQANSALYFTGAGLAPDFVHHVTLANPGPTRLTNTAKLDLPLVNSTKISRFDVKTGSLTGSFIIGTRRAPFSGLIVKITGSTQGYGFFLLPTGVPNNTTSPKLSGRVVLGVR